jgi:CheY-like chemotaxis protein
LRKEELDLTEVVQCAVDDHRPVLEANGLTLTFSAPREPVCVVGDPARITQIVGNLLTNAGKFTDGGGQVDVRLEIDPSNRAIIRVTDTGIGIEPQLLARLFQPFSQADGILDRHRGGLGLGLALVKGLAELHGGHVEAASAGLGHGSQFTVLLPGVVRHLPPGAPTTSGAPQPVRPQLILVIEDNHDAAETLQLLLELSGHTVVVAHSGPEGLKSARAHQPDVILCDIGLPGMNGYEVAQAVRKCDDLKSVFLIAMTGYGQDEDRRRALEAGFDHHLTKPVEPEMLERLLAR